MSRLANLRLAALAGCALAMTSCAAAARTSPPPPPPPPRPSLPAVKFVAPCDPQATVGLTPEGVEELKKRDAAWRAHVERLESMLQQGAR
ncbi:MAG TPA: hypothetical protein VFD92_12605 [Candidatus Binatia bacterium]|nr:hypothetical protein [Candidatus Binatia bacterium]